MSPTSAGFRLYHSNALEVLAGILAEVLRAPVSRERLLEPDIVLIPQAAMRRWLQATLAARHGVAANIEFLTPGEFVGRALDANLGPADGELDARTLHWHLYAALTDRALLEQPALAAIAAHVGGDDPLRPWSLAGELASVFEKYQAWRRDWLLRWEGGADPDDPQAILWRRVARGTRHRARRIQDYLERFEAPDAALPAGLPARLSAFATLNVSPDVLRVVATQARVGTLHCFVPSPSQAYWGDLQRMRTVPEAALATEGALLAGGESRLLQAWGAAGVDFMRLVGNYEVVHASAELRAHADPAEGGGPLQGSLLRRMQSDVFHRRGEPGFALRPAVDRTDPSLQLHACHTRLRELQVLRDQMRALFDDDRFDPPLQPREVAVLAPDIDPYLPYLGAVFGDRGADDAIPYALADASPLANEPLAEVFLRLLALPVSRFGLHEILDLLASPALAEANGLDAPAIERLQAWLSEAGARWGLDARHRARFDAPEDEAYTWAFALDRLLLGHASGSDALVRASDGRLVAPLPDLEGGAMDALDTLLRLLRVLERHAELLGEAMPPAQWRERLLELLDALLPRPPASAAGQRALDRLRTLVDAFARNAGDAGFDAPVPAEAVRAHFGAVLAEADVRAPLLTGGVSIARMVPMRLLPFRVICVLGMNDAEFPRRDPAPGLNRLTAELGTGRRRAGDRSTRDDDRFLFLQLFTAAQDVFYVSWQGADPRDGSRREPSVLVSELIDAAAAQHAADAADDIAEALVVRHPLQPFSAEAFGPKDEPRRFSYHARWQQAAAGAADRRVPLPPWFEGAPLAGDDLEPELPIGALRRFLLQPAESLLERMGLRLVEIEAHGDDVEPLAAPERGLERSVLQRALFDELLQGHDEARIHATLRARGLLPSGASGRRVLADQREVLAPWLEAFGAWRGNAQPRSLPAEVEIDGVRVHGRIQDAWPQGIARLRFGKPNGPSVIRSGLDWLLARAAGIDLPFLDFFETDPGAVGPYARAPLSPAEARDALRRLLALRAQGLREPLPYAPYSAWAYASADNADKAVEAARKQWHGAGGGFAEGQGDALRQVLRGCDPFADEPALVRFADAAMTVFLAVRDGQAYEGVDPGTLAGLARAHDPEEVE
ncbi:exodeoxyribonuclease V subunit gamma [Luteimonas granuli]|uniref:RecBCD enzyme subunit RecC n=1 Tax=Luteimonas granuli TaxID=1176533 RepID=A0A518N444_9GAMM|nr:exodeoxyribonuclease V subunit gamma [Luteimonas granuli]QDW66699.1 exodeoxyribonuclease V subunit gamma [Luteimonas granuli]